MVYFSDIFNVDESILESYGAMNISLLNDIPLFIDPFLLYASEKPEYRQLHENILDYLSFLRDKASGFIDAETKCKLLIICLLCCWVHLSLAPL